ncbi:MAG: LPS export ABC transporter periplasmic protein LptC [Bacteroidia bacterium]|nr:LPS export ABC transporter periplasmic protein LptC [Bacteroidia bacterium]
MQFKFPAFLIVVACVIVNFTVSCTGDKARKNVSEMKKADTLISSEQGTNVTITYSDSGRLKARMFAPKLLGFKSETDPYFKMPEGLVARFYNELGEEESYLEAENGISYQARKIVEVNRNVVVRNAKGEKMNTEKLTWDQKKAKIYTDKFVKITTKNEIITGVGMEAKQDFSEWYIKNVNGRITIANDSTSKK